MDCEVWVKMPPFWGNTTDAITGDTMLVKPRHLLSMGYTPSHTDKCLFLNDKLGEKNAVLIWVDDFIYMHEEETTFDAFMKQLRVHFNVPCVGPLNAFLGMEISHELASKRMRLNQRNSINVLLERAKMVDCNSATIPCPPGFVFTTKDSPSTPNSSVTEYRSLVALANFISCWTRPDITYTVNKLCGFMANW